MAPAPLSRAAATIWRAVEIGRDRSRPGDLDRPVGGQYRRRPGVGGVVNHHGFEPERLHGAQDAQRDLATIGDEHALERPAAVSGTRLSGLVMAAPSAEPGRGR